jgi:RNA polymerase sigma factor (sigma-70 family)
VPASAFEADDVVPGARRGHRAALAPTHICSAGSPGSGLRSVFPAMIPATIAKVEGFAPVGRTSTLEGAYRAHAQELTAFATTLVGPGDAPDVVAGAVTRVVAGGRWVTIRNPRAYLYQAVYREAVSLQRQFGRRTRLAIRLRASVPHEHARPADELADTALINAVRDLPLRQRAVIVLTYWQDLAPDEVASRLGISTGAVKKHLARGRANVRRALS